MSVKNFIGLKNVINQVRKRNKNENYISYKSTKQLVTPPIFPTTQSDKSNSTSKTDKGIEAKEWKPGTILIVGDSTFDSLRKAKLSRKRKVEVRFFSGAKLNDLHY